MYFPVLAYPDSTLDAGYFIVRASGDPAALVDPVRRAIKSADERFSTDAVQPLSVGMRNSISQERLVARLATGFGVLALILAAIGLYGVLTYAVTRRTNEIGLRVALGAVQGDVVRMVMGDALKLVLIGVVIGAPLAVFATRLLRSQLHGVAPTDPVAIAVALAVLAGSAVLAALLPARRASRLDPLTALRAE
jgi:ABC-type antimicrobial peptide transport system permease subunit